MKPAQEIVAPMAAPASPRKCAGQDTVLHRPDRITHAVEVSAALLFEAAALAVAQFRRCGFVDAALGPGTSLAVAVQQPATTHTLRLARLDAWLNSSGKSPAEQALKVRLKQELGRTRQVRPTTLVNCTAERESGR